MSDPCLICLEACLERMPTCSCGFIHQTCINDMSSLHCPICRVCWADLIMKRINRAADELMLDFIQSRLFFFSSCNQVLNRLERLVNKELIKETLTTLLLTNGNHFFTFRSKNKTLTFVCDQQHRMAIIYPRITFKRVHSTMLSYTMENVQKRASIIFRILV